MFGRDASRLRLRRMFMFLRGPPVLHVSAVRHTSDNDSPLAGTFQHAPRTGHLIMDSSSGS